MGTLSGELRLNLRGTRILIVDDDVAVLRVLLRSLQRLECACDTAQNVEEALARFAAAPYDVALVDVNLGAQSGEQVLKGALSLAHPPHVFMMSGMASIDLAVRAMRLGAADFFEKPIHDGALLVRIANVLEAARVRRQLDALTAREARSLLGAPASPAMAQVMNLAKRVAETPSSSALITGESGVGKEVLASYIHRNSARAEQSFVRVNVAAIPESMLEAELFGSVKGAFTDSKQSRVGYIASADRGTLLLDEIGELKVEYQPKLLRVLEERRFFPMGSDREREVDVRFLAATNREPEAMIAGGILRRDLFYRLGVVVRIPPLRERVEEILPLAKHFVAHYCAEFVRQPMEISPAAAERLVEHSWPGNIRELRNVMERAVMIAAGEELRPEMLDLVAMSSPPSDSVPVQLPVGAGPESESSMPVAARAAAEQVERQRIIDVLKVVGGSKSRAAVTLGVSRSTLYEKLRRYAIE